MDDIKIGDYVAVPKGTMVFDSDFVLAAQFGAPSKRASKGRVTQVRNCRSEMRGLIEPECMVAILAQAGMSQYYNGRQHINWSKGDWDRILAKSPLAVAAMQGIRDQFGDDFRFVEWGSSRAHIGAVQKIDPPAPKEAKVSLLKQMVKGSRWRFTRAVTITAWVFYERDHRLVAEADAWRAAGKPYDYNNPYEHAREMPIFTIPAGLEFTVSSDKKTAANHQKDSARAIRVDLDESQIEYHITHTRPDGSSGGHGVPAWEYWGGNPWWQNGFTLSYRQIEHAIEAIDIPSTEVFVLRDGPQGKYFAGFDFDHGTRTEQVRMVDTFSSAKKYRTVGNAKSSVLSWTGFLEGKNIDRPEIASSRKMDLPDTWVLVPVNPVTLQQGKPVDTFVSDLVATWLKHN